MTQHRPQIFRARRSCLEPHGLALRDDIFERSANDVVGYAGVDAVVGRVIDERRECRLELDLSDGDEERAGFGASLQYAEWWDSFLSHESDSAHLAQNFLANNGEILIACCGSMSAA